MRKTSLLFLLLTLGFVLGRAGGAAAQTAPLRDWTLLVFMNADNDLEPYGDKDLAEMAEVDRWQNLLKVHP